jgi:DNA helicase-2/ATP-dependent DNA helicase PcrA
MEHLERDGDTAGERQDNVRELLSSAAHAVPAEVDENPGTPLDLFLQQSALVAGVDTLAAEADAVTMMTVHNAKGLEFPVVFVSGLEDGLFPLARAFDYPAQLEEERRLLYVGVTRARSHLYLSYASSRRRNGELRRSPMSSFLKGQPQGLWRDKPTIRFRAAAQADSAIAWSPARRPTYGIPAGRTIDRTEDFSQDGPSITLGSRVKHASFGAGTISNVSGIGRDAKVTVDFDDENIGRKRLVLAYAGLQNGWDE